MQWRFSVKDVEVHASETLLWSSEFGILEKVEAKLRFLNTSDLMTSDWRFLEGVSDNHPNSWEIFSGVPSGSGLPPMKWSAVMFRKTEDQNGYEATQAGRNCHEATAS